MSVLILSQYGDVHAEAVHWALNERGIPVRRWTVSDFPARQRVTASLSSNRELQLEILDDARSGALVDGRLRDPSAVWNRRLGKPSLHAELDPDYAPFVREECRRFIQSVPHIVAPDAKWINEPAAARLYEGKLPQLMQARRAGLAIPDTIVTNDPEKVRALCDRYGAIIYKAFLVPSWNFGDEAGRKLAVTFTTKLTRETLDQHLPSVSFAPGIFQPLIPKKSELRVVVLGGRLIAARLDSQSASDTAIDWRAGESRFAIEKVRLPEHVEKGILQFMKACGLCFGCIDLIETPSGSHVFLEVNQMGQFLWLDEANDELDTFQEFCSFLSSAAGLPTVPEEFPDYRDYRASTSFEQFAQVLDPEELYYQNQQTYVLA
ncbi:MAG TPA: hypothetical protein VGC56_11995 [Allosphingosinicella sp.]|jgi:hypothetical protein